MNVNLLRVKSSISPFLLEEKPKSCRERDGSNLTNEKTSENQMVDLSKDLYVNPRFLSSDTITVEPSEYLTKSDPSN